MKLLLALCLLACTVAAAQDFSKERSYVHQLQIGGASGSSVAIADGYLLTSAHVALAIPKANITIDEKAKARIIKVDPVSDLALLYAPDIHCPCAVLADSLPVVDEELVGVGFPLHELIEVQIATEGRYQGVNSQQQLVTTVNITFGNSGGGMFTKKDSKLVGIVDSIIGIPQGPPNLNINDFHHYVSIGVAIHMIRAFIRLPLGQPTPEGLRALDTSKTFAR